MSPNSIGNERLWRTNPVWCVEQWLEANGHHDGLWVDRDDNLLVIIGALLAKGVRLPTEPIEKWGRDGLLNSSAFDELPRARPCPGVVGLVVDDFRDAAWVVPLEVEASRTWSVDPNLPFRPATVLQDVLIRLIESLGLPQARGVPERFAFDIREALGRPCDGDSMHIAGMLAVIDQMNDRPALFRRACAVVQPNRDALECVGSVERKLAAFVREYGDGTLLVRAACTEAAAFDGYFEQVWEVGTFHDLARHLEQERLLQPFLNGKQLDKYEIEIAHPSLRRLADGEHRYDKALDLAERIENCGYSAAVPARTRTEIRQTISNLYRHLGYFQEAESLAEHEANRVRASQATSYDDLALADTNRAASLYDPHRFAEIEGILGRCAEKLAEDPRLVSAETRVKVFNTLARARVIVDRGEWEALFRQSEAILLDSERTQLPRTWNELAHGLLRHGRLDEAGSVLTQVENWPGLAADDMSRLFCQFHLAELHCLRGRCWVSEEFERPVTESNVPAHPLGFYLQATARQPGRNTADALERFGRARKLFLQDAGSGDRPNVLHFLAACMRLAEGGWGNNAGLWREARQALGRQLEPRAGCALDSYYSDVWKGLCDHPDRDAADAFLRRIPYF